MPVKHYMLATAPLPVISTAAVASVSKDPRTVFNAIHTVLAQAALLPGRGLILDLFQPRLLLPDLFQLLLLLILQLQLSDRNRKR